MVPAGHGCLNGVRVAPATAHGDPMSALAAPVPGRPGTTGLLTQVRQATRATHQALDALLPRGLRDLPDYRRYLGALLPLADWLAQGPRDGSPAHCGEWHDPERLRCLRADCDALGVAAVAADAPRAPDWAHWIGGCYVIEGSALGARLLSRHAAGLAATHAGVRAARRFLAHITADPPRWGRFVRLLDTLPPGHAAAVASGARTGFAIVHARLATGECPA